MGGTAPSLRERSSLQSLPRLVTAVWNHVPRMSTAINDSGMRYPAMSSEEMAQLFAYLYVTGVTDKPGNASRGYEVFSAKRCTTCHSGSSKAPSVVELGRAQSPLELTEALWNHASGMSVELHSQKKDWPTLNAGELRDIFAYIRSSASQSTSTERPGDPARGWRVFQQKSCMDCHTLGGRSGNAYFKKTSAQSPRPLGGDTLPPTLSQFGEAMLNHFPDMNRVLSAGGKTPPSFAAGEFVDLAVFLYSLRYAEPTGSPHVGSSIFEWRGCAACHGEDASGGSAPALRGRGQSYTAVRLAAGLWRHGAQMYAVTQRNHQAWPALQESDIGDLLAFLNTPLESSH